MLRELGRVFKGEQAPSYRLGVVLVAGAGALFSFTALLFRAVESATDWQFLAYRGVGIAAAMVTLIVVRHPFRPVRSTALNWQSITAGLLMASLSMLFILALARTTAALVIFLQSASPFVAALLGWLVLGETVDRRTWSVMAAAAVGVVLMVGGGLEAGSAGGLLLAGLIPLVLGLYNVLVRSAPDRDPVVPALVGGVVLTLVAGAVAVATDGLSLTGRDVALSLVSGGVLLGLGLPMFNLGHVSVPTVQVSLLWMTEIVLAPLWVWIWPGETPSSRTLIGGAIVLAAVVALALTSPGGDGVGSAVARIGRATGHGRR